MAIEHHPDDSTLMCYAAGSLPSSLAAVVAAHVEGCPHCMGELRLMEDIGHAILEGVEASQVQSASPVMALRRLQADVLPMDPPRTAEQDAIAGDCDVPRVLHHLLGAKLDSIKWKRLGPGIWHHRLSVNGEAGGDLRLIKVGPGRAMPDHGHGGTELTLILRGAYEDATGRYMVGDIADLDDDVEHKPIADAVEGCICLIASEQKARFKGIISRMVQPLTGL